MCLLSVSEASLIKSFSGVSQTCPLCVSLVLKRCPLDVALVSPSCLSSDQVFRSTSKTATKVLIFRLVTMKLYSVQNIHGVQPNCQFWYLSLSLKQWVGRTRSNLVTSSGNFAFMQKLSHQEDQEGWSHTASFVGKNPKKVLNWERESPSHTYASDLSAPSPTLSRNHSQVCESQQAAVMGYFRKLLLLLLLLLRNNWNGWTAIYVWAAVQNFLV